jgi:hypothetical protein
MEAHSTNKTKYGGETNIAISRNLKCKEAYSEELDNQYVNYCNYLGVVSKPSGNFRVKRKFWFLKKS